MNCKHKFQTKYEAKIKLIRCYSKQVTFLRYYCKKWKVFTVQNYESMSIKLSGKTIIIREDFIYFIRESILLYIKRKKNSNGEMKLLSSRLYFSLVTPRQIGPASCQNFSRIQVYFLCIQYTDSLNHIMILCYTWKEVDHTQYKDLWHQVFVPYFHLYFLVHFTNQ